MIVHIKDLKVLDRPGIYTPALESQRKIEFHEFIVSLNSVLQLYSLFAETNDLQHMIMY